MADREIRCARCKLYLGVIRDAKLRKTMVHHCDDCNTAYKALEMARNTGNDKSQFGDIFGDTFGDIFGGKKY